MHAIYLGRIDYKTALALQEQLFYERLMTPDVTFLDIILFAEHNPVYTYGPGVKNPRSLIKDWRFVKEQISKKEVSLLQTSRGGLITFHGPGQLVGYPIFNIGRMAMKDYVHRVAMALRQTLSGFGIQSSFKDSGLWVETAGTKRKICSFGFRTGRNERGDTITMHGFALNVSTDMKYFEAIYPCGITDDSPMINLREVVAEEPDLKRLTALIAKNLSGLFGSPMLYMAEPETIGFYPDKKPSWLRMDKAPDKEAVSIANLMRSHSLTTVCEEARCPNLAECWKAGDATIMILGDVCTRSCGFCAVTHAKPAAVDWTEPARVAEAVAELSHSHIVITSVDRDELPDGGSEIWAATIRTVKRASPEKTVEVLTPDFKGVKENLWRVLDAGPDVFGHNLETVRRLHKRVRPQGNYDRSLNVLAMAKEHALAPITKSNLMLGHGESGSEIIEAMRDLRRAGVDIITITQYLRPTRSQLPVIKYYAPGEFYRFERIARNIGFPVVVAGPMVRTSYRAGRAYQEAILKRQIKNPGS